MRAVIIGSGSINDYEYIKSKIRPNDFIICADGGYDYAVKLGVIPNILIGDFDSIEKLPSKTEIIKYPKRKDFTDGELAVRYAVEHGFDDVLLLAMTGDRADHSITDILLLTQCKNGCVIDDNNEIYLLRDTVSITGKIGDTISIVPIGGDVEGITTKNLEYPLNNETLYFGESRGVSNVMCADNCEITAEKGIGLIIKVRKV
jgi:thiamine pyrophosphokinase